MNNRILNREGQLPQDNWYMVAKTGEFPVAIEMTDGKKEVFLQVIDDVSVASMLNRFNEAKAADPTLELLVDRDHFSDNTDLPSEAYGWIQNLQNREGDLWAQINWTSVGAEAVRNKVYRFLSPVWDLPDCEKLGNRRLRPLRLDKAAVTNEPNIKGMAPLKNRNNALGQEQRKGVQTMDFKAQLLAVIGAAPDLADDKIEAAATAFKTEIQNRKTELDTIKNRVTDLEKKELEALVEKDLDTHKDKITNRDDMKALLIANRENGLKVLALMKAVEPQKALNRAAAQTPAGEQTADKSAERQAFVDELKIKNRCSNTEAWAQAARIKPELFK